MVIFHQIATATGINICMSVALKISSDILSQQGEVIYFPYLSFLCSTEEAISTYPRCPFWCATTPMATAQIFGVKELPCKICSIGCYPSGKFCFCHLNYMHAVLPLQSATKSNLSQVLTFSFFHIVPYH